MVTEQAILDVLRTIDDPEMPINIVDLGIVEGVRVVPHRSKGGAGSGTPATADTAVAHRKQGELEPVTVAVDVLPTFVGCPALSVIEDEIRKRVRSLAGVAEVVVSFKYDPPWTVDRISGAGRESLRKFGVTVPQRGPEKKEQGDEAPVCPFCGSHEVKLESSFGPTRCRMIYHCEACRNPFEHLKRVSLTTLEGTRH
jgi:ring-1,2-phenylacetyl-CoA epoxidase subunit PaaD